MPTSTFLKAVTAGAMLWAPVALATGNSLPSLTEALSAGDAKKVTKPLRSIPTKRPTRMIESLKPVDSKLPDTARRDATAGVFI